MNLLYDSIFTVETANDRKKCSLPGIYRLLQNNAIESFARLQSHQKQAWHCFLAQLGAIATEDRPMPETKEDWRKALLDQASEAAWNLQTDDLSKPAFMQPPVPKKSGDSRKESVSDWDEIHVTEYDVPVLSKNHALKKHRMHSPKPEQWAYMLVNVQTSGFYSPGGRSHSRMASRTASRPFFGTTPSLEIGDWIMHDVERLRRYADKIEEHYEYNRNVPPLLWTVQWEEGETLSLADLHPLYVDCSRRIRRKETWKKKSTDADRIDGIKTHKGLTGDPWTPIDDTNEDPQALNARRKHFRYRGLSQILFGRDYELPPGFRDVGDGFVVCRAITGVKGKRNYTLERVIHFTQKESVNPFAENDDTTESAVAREAKTRVQEAETAVSILSDALDWLFCEDVEEGPRSGLMSAYKRQKPNEPEKAYDRQQNALHSRIDQRFFDRLFQAPDYDKSERRSHWQDLLVDQLRKQWEEAKTMCPSSNRWNRLAEAESIIDRRISSFDHATNR
jgi:CRISPR system Cascade subunit CasA